MMLRLCLVLAASLASCAPDAAPVSDLPTEAPWFKEASAQSGIAFQHSVARERHYYMPETATGGVALLDFDIDGDLDIYLVQGGDLVDVGAPEFANRLYRNEGNGQFVDVTASAGVGDSSYGMGCAVGDFDGDGDPDLYVTNVGPNVLYRNEGDGTFTDVSVAAGVAHPGLGSSCAFADTDGDGDLDLFVVNYINWSVSSEIDCTLGSGLPDYCSPKNYKSPAPDVLYENQGDGSFLDISVRSGLREVFGNGLGVAFADFNSDGAQDVYVANDGNPNQLWINDGAGNFVDRAVVWGCAVNMNGTAEAGMGVAVADGDHDGDPDLFMTHLRAETNTFYENRGTYFKDVTPLIGLAMASRDFTGFGVGFGDFDHDGVLDAYVANGRVKHDARPFSKDDLYAEPNQLFRGDGAGAFNEVFPRGAVSEPLIHSSRGAAFGDLDNDGDLDIVIVNSQGPANVLFNQVGDRGNWIQFRVLNEAGGYALGAKLSLGSGTTQQHRTVRRGYSYCASNDPRVHFGLGGMSIVETITVHWPDGQETQHGPLAAGSTHEIRR